MAAVNGLQIRRKSIRTRSLGSEASSPRPANIATERPDGDGTGVANTSGSVASGPKFRDSVKALRVCGMTFRSVDDCCNWTAPSHPAVLGTELNHGVIMRTFTGQLAAATVSRILTVAFALALATPAAAAVYPLELVSPRAAGSSPTAGGPTIGSANRIFRAYPGLEYNIRAVVFGGAYPYTFSLTNAPAGMTIDSRTGTIVWPNPQANASPTITVRDFEGAVASSTWNIAVGTAGFRFIDAVNGRNGSGNNCTSSCGTGTFANPWRTIKDMWVSSGASAGEFLYFRRGTYTVTDLLPRGSTGTAWERVDFHSQSKPVVWMAYPGEAPVIDFSFQPGEWGPLIRFNGNNIYIDGFECIRTHIIGFQFTSGPGSDFNTLRRLKMHQHGPAGDGTNGSQIMTTTAADQSRYMTIQDSEFFQAPGELSIKIYAQRKLLIEDNVFHDVTNGVELKAIVPQFTVRGNLFYNISGIALGGNMHDSLTSGEILFNLVRDATTSALDLNQDSMAAAIYVSRNTFIGEVRLREVDAADGPFYLNNNVIINNVSGTPAGSHLTYYTVLAPSRIIAVNNLAGFPNNNIVDGSGALTPAYSQYIGTHGHLGGGGSQLGLPSAPRNLRITPQD